MEPEEFKPINQILPVSESQEENIPLSDILTEVEKESAINHAIDQEKRKSFRRMSSYAGTDHIIKHMNEYNWLSVINTEEILKQANQRKHWVVEKENERQLELDEKKKYNEDLSKKCDANYFFELIRTYITRVDTNTEKKGTFIFNDDNLQEG